MSTNKSFTTAEKQQHPTQKPRQHQHQHQASISHFFQRKTSSSATQSQCSSNNNKRRRVQQLGTHKPLKVQSQDAIEILDNDDDDKEGEDCVIVSADETTRNNRLVDDDAADIGTNTNDTLSGTFAGAKTTEKSSNQAEVQQEVVAGIIIQAPERTDKNHNVDSSSYNQTKCSAPGGVTVSILDKRRGGNDSTQTLQAEANCVHATAASSSNSAVANPFARFTASASSSDKAMTKTSSNARWSAPTMTTAVAGKNVKSKATTATASLTAGEKKKGKKKTKSSDWIKMADLPVEQQEQIVTKWHFFLPTVGPKTSDDDEHDDEKYLENCRFQLLVAARLHAQCQEVSVHKAMSELRKHFANHVISAPVLAQADPLEWEACITNLQYYHTKARHIQMAANEIMTNPRFGGKVPEQVHELMTLTGIGPVLADLLAFVNTRQQHEKRKQINER